MANVQELADSIANEQQPRVRRKKLLELLDKIVRGEIDSSEITIDELFKMHTGVRDQYQLGGPRRQYISPADRSSYDYGYMKIPEMGGAGMPNVWDP